MGYPWVLEKLVGQVWERVERKGYKYPHEASQDASKDGEYRVRHIMTGETVPLP